MKNRFPALGIYGHGRGARVTVVCFGNDVTNALFPHRLANQLLCNVPRRSARSASLHNNILYYPGSISLVGAYSQRGFS
jgi:hypothetical protein